MHSIASYLPRVASKDDVIPLAYSIISTTGETIKEIPIRAGQVIYTTFAAYHRYVMRARVHLHEMTYPFSMPG